MKTSPAITTICLFLAMALASSCVTSGRSKARSRTAAAHAGAGSKSKVNTQKAKTGAKQLGAQHKNATPAVAAKTASGMPAATAAPAPGARGTAATAVSSSSPSSGQVTAMQPMQTTSLPPVGMTSASAVAAASNTGLGFGSTPQHPAAHVMAEGSDDTRTELGSYAIRREIAMFYTLDMKRNNRHSERVASVVRAYDEDVRTCYSDRLEDAPQLRGQMTFAFKLSRSKGGISKIARLKDPKAPASGALTDMALEACVKGKLTAMMFYPPRDMTGTIAFRFDVTQSVSTPVRQELALEP